MDITGLLPTHPRAQRHAVRFTIAMRFTISGAALHPTPPAEGAVDRAAMEGLLPTGAGNPVTAATPAAASRRPAT